MGFRIALRVLLPPDQRAHGYALEREGENGFKNSNENSNELTYGIEDRMHGIDLITLSDKLI